MAQKVVLPQGPVSFREFGDGEPVLFVHGFLVDGRLWDGVATRLASSGHRCIVPDWPFGSHREAMSPSADLSPPGVAGMIAALLEELGLDRVTLVGNDSGGAMSQVFTAEHPDRVNALVLTNCDMFENFPPKAFQPLIRVAKLPGGLRASMAPMRIGAVRRLLFKPFTKHAIDPALVDAWCEPYFADSAIARDTLKFVVGMDNRHALAAAERLRGFERPVRMAWGLEDRFFKLDDAKRLASMVAESEITEIADAKTFVSLDQPARVAEAVAAATARLRPAAAA